MILAAGFGKRLLPLTDHTPKPLVAVAGVAVLARVLRAVKDYGVGQVVINSHHLAPQIDSFMRGVGRDILGNTPCHVIYEPDILESGGGVKNALPLLGDKPFFVINGDGFWQDGDWLKNLANNFAPTEMDVLLALVARNQLVATSITHGDFLVDAHGLLQRDKGEDAMVFAGVQVMTPRVFDDITDKYFSLNKIYDQAMARQKLYGLAMAGKFFAIGTPDDITLAEGNL